MIKKAISFLVIVGVLIFIFLIANIDEINRKFIYPLEYTSSVEKFSAVNNIDKYLVYSIIKTESGFDENAVSSVGARGLMQIMEDAFDWVKMRMDDDREITYDDMFTAEYNIEYGVHLYSLLYEEYGSNETALVAYFCGRGQVNKWLLEEEYSSDGVTFDKIPTRASNHYVDKVLTAYENYINLYEN